MIPDHLIGEILTKRWTDNAIPFLALVITVAGFGHRHSGLLQAKALIESTRQLGEFSIVVTGLTIVMLGGGIDLSVGSIFALATLRRGVERASFLSCPVWVGACSPPLATGARVRRRSMAISSAICGCAPS